MKKTLNILTAGIFALATGTTILTSVNNISSTTKNNYVQKENTSNETALFNNNYGFLNNNDWITNQSTVDHKFYSYDTSALVAYDFNNARNTFLVDNSGNLAYNPEITIPDEEKVNIENTKQQMITYQKITIIKDDYNPYSKSQYSNTYFSGNNNWQYVQFGGIEKHIDISSQTGAHKVEYNNNLSESWGLYYIAKAVQENKITQKIGNDLGTYFINQTSIKNNFNKNLTIKIIDLIIQNNDIYHLFSTGPTIAKNNSTNFIFDNNNNNLVKVYYNQWNNINNAISTIKESYTYAPSYDGNFNYLWCWTDSKIVINWKRYANTWNYFTAMYPTFNFGTNSYLLVNNNQTGTNKNTNLSDNTAAISNNKPLDLSKLENVYSNWKSSDYYKFEIFKEYNNGPYWSQVVAALYMWYDDNNIYCQTSGLIACNYVSIKGNSIKYNLENCIFNNVMN